MSDAKVAHIVQNLELIDLEHHIAASQPTDRDTTRIADSHPGSSHPLALQSRLLLPKILPIQEDSSGSSNQIPPKQLVFNKKR